MNKQEAKKLLLWACDEAKTARNPNKHAALTKLAHALLALDPHLPKDPAA